ncbi:hypothetical protein LUZ60_000969 [Juncus effusus]|nr:hypothetical protein LUZ60_000969 [Juncus effusus]
MYRCLGYFIVSSESIVYIINCNCIIFRGFIRGSTVSALISVKNKLNDTKGVLRTWNASDPSPCSWNHVICNNQSSVVQINLGDSSLSGTLAPEIGQLSNLKYMEFNGNNLSGQIPREIGNLTELLSLDLYSNNLGGQIPNTLGNLSSLRFLRLNNNSLSGSIPVSLTALSALQILDLSNNNLNGEVPSNGSFRYFSPLSFENNQLLCGKTVGKPCSAPTPSPSPLSFPPVTHPKKVKLHDVLSLFFLALLLFASGGLLFCLCCHRREHLYYAVEIESSKIKRFSFQQMQVATEGFSNDNILGRGGSGKVYKGRLANGLLVAVKRLDPDSILSGLQDFKNEVEIFGDVLHRNMLPLLGFCMTPKERLLVYPYMANGSVASCLQERSPKLDWRTRKRIAVQSAKALAYLHHRCTPKIIHCDIKAANILLDDQFQAVVGDFGLATVMDKETSEVITSVRGTCGHIAPEYLSLGVLSDKVDVYAYGITLLELVTGQGPFSLARLARDEDVLLLHWVASLVDKQRLKMLVDPDLREDYQNIEPDVESVVQLAMLCTQYSPANRPTMSDVVRMLEYDEGIDRLWLRWRKEKFDDELRLEKASRRLLRGLYAHSDIKTSMTSASFWTSSSLALDD